MRPEGLTEFYVTFGQQYRREPHPTFEPAHPDGWVTVVAPDEVVARKLAVALLGTAWCSFEYEQPHPAVFHLGELARLEVQR